MSTSVSRSLSTTLHTVSALDASSTLIELTTVSSDSYDSWSDVRAEVEQQSIGSAGLEVHRHFAV